MIQLNHLNLVVSDVAGAVALFETYFEFRTTDVKGDGVVTVLKGADGFTLVVMKEKSGEPSYPGAFHIGFMLESEEAVVRVHESLLEGGVAVGQGPRKIRDSFGFYFSFENVMIEVGHYL